MKKFMIAPLVAIASLGLAACGGGTPTENVEANDSFAAESNLTAIDEPFPANDQFLGNDSALSNDIDLNTADPALNAADNGAL